MIISMVRHCDLTSSLCKQKFCKHCKTTSLFLTMEGQNDSKQSAVSLKIFSDETEVSTKLSEFIISVSNEAISRHNVFTIGLSGGSAAKFLSENLPKYTTDWSKWRVFFCDERHVKQDDPECTYAFYKQHLFQKIQIPSDCIYPEDCCVTVEEAAEKYSDSLKSVFGQKSDWPEFDLLLLGMGPDGHTCSLFPGHHLLKEDKKWVAAIKDSPKPPSERVTFTLPVLLHCRCAVFAACGAGKADIVKRVLEGNENPPLPAALVRPLSGTVYWFLDKAAANNLTHTTR